MKQHLILLLCALLSLTGFAKSYPVYQLARPPHVDGKLDDYAWTRLPSARGFQVLGKPQHFITIHLTSFQIGYHQNKLYLAVRCQEPDLKKLRALDSFRDGYAFNDSIEFFLRKHDGPFLQLVMNAKGARWMKWENRKQPTEPPRTWKACTAQTPDGWTLESELPFKDLELEDLKNLTFNVARNVPHDPWFKFQSWADILGGFSDVQRFATLSPKTTYAPSDLELESHRINETYDKRITWKLHEIKTAGKPWKEAQTRFSQNQGFEALHDIQKDIAKHLYSWPISTRGNHYRRWLTALQKISIPVRTIELTIKGQHLTDVSLQANGKHMPMSANQASFRLQEGLTVLTVTVKAQQDARLHMESKDFPMLNRRWTYTTHLPKEDWTKINFDDSDWKPFTGQVPQGTAYLRQIIIWNERHDGAWRCLNPPVQQWQFSQDSIEPITLELYSPTGLKLRSFRFSCTLPKGCRLVDMMTGSKHPLSTAPVHVAQMEVPRGTDCTLTYDPKLIHPTKTSKSILTVYKDSTGKPGDTFSIPYARLINDNITEIGGSLPCAVLPPINGRKLKKLVMSYYQGYIPQRLSKDAYDLVARDNVKAGADRFIMYPGAGPQVWRQAVKDHGGRIMLGSMGHPLMGSQFIDCQVTELFRKHPDLFCHFLDGTRPKPLDQQVSLPWPKEILGCPSLLTTTYSREFYQAIQQDYKDIHFKTVPDSPNIFFNWEQEPWQGGVFGIPEKPKRAFCFCQLCLKNFRTWAKLPPNAPLTPQLIYEKYHDQWREFRYTQDAAMHLIMAKALKELGKTMYFYSNTNQYGYWLAAKDNPYLVFLGCPGNPSADRNTQVSIDAAMEFHMGTCGRKHIAGQRFIHMGSDYGCIYTPKAWQKNMVLSDDGYIHPETWKWEVVRILATMHGGLDLHNPITLLSGIKYYIGEATRMVAHYEDIFYDGVRDENLATSTDIAYPDMLVLKYQNQRLILLFNETQKPRTVTVKSLKAAETATAHAFYQNKTLNAGQFTITIPARDLEAIHIQE